MADVRIPRWDVWGAVTGLAIGVGDTALLVASGVDMTLAGRDATLLVCATFTSSLVLGGFLAGSLARARARAREDAATIRRQEAALAESRRAAFENEKLAAIGRLAAGIAHEVRNPLGVIRASAALVQDHFREGDDPHRACRFILEEIDRLDALIASLLAFARPTQLHTRRTAVADLAARAELLAEEVLRRRGVSFVRHASDAAASEIEVDPELVSQALLDLVTNAAEAVASGGRVELRARSEPGAVVLAVADDGPGVAAEDRERIFEPFYTTKASGTGLGLAMVERIARAHGGAIRVVPGAGAGPRGSGACFEVVLPHAGPGADGGLAAGAAA
jgi:two-component system sensor histidine kinase HydH